MFVHGLKKNAKDEGRGGEQRGADGSKLKDQ